MFGSRLVLVGLLAGLLAGTAWAGPPSEGPLPMVAAPASTDISAPTESAAPQPNLLSALADLQAQARALATPPPGVTWGQQQAVDDLQRLESTTRELQTALTTDPQVTPTQLHPLRDQLVVARMRLQASLPLLGVGQAQSDALFAQLDRVGLCLRTLEYRFDGRAQLQGPALALAGVVEAPNLPHYSNPQELLLEARNVRYLAEAFTRLRSVWRGATSPGWGWGTEIYDFVAAAFDYESACNWRYPNVRDTRPAYNKLVRTYNKARGFGYGLDSFRWTDLEKAFTRLEQFYAAAP